MSSSGNESLKVACVGAGLIGRAWAIAFARAGYTVHVYDVSHEALERAMKATAETLSILLGAGGAHDAKAVASRIHYHDNLGDAVANAAYVQESVTEDLQTKRDFFSQLDRLAPADAIIASSTSQLSPAQFMETPLHPARCLVAHPVNPPYLIPLVELCASPWTSEETVKRAEKILGAAGMSPVRVRKPITGFLLNRLQAAVLGEALHLVQEGYCGVDDIERVMTDGLALRWAFLGPFTTGHLNAIGGYREYMGKYSGALRHMTQDLDVNHAWAPGIFNAIADELETRIPPAEVPAAQQWRDRVILELRPFLELRKAAYGKGSVAPRPRQQES